jgi:ATP-dependent helicase/nuclease subunit A
VVQHLAEEFFAGVGARPDVTRTIFAVGDYKQSIYGFQRADPREFQRMRLHFAMRVGGAERIWDEVQLETSFRSTPAVLASVDAVFARPEALAGVTPDDAPIHHVPHRKGAGGLVEIWPLEEPAERDPFESWTPPVEQRAGHDPETELARLIARRIAEWIDRKEMLTAKGRPIRPGDVMVLVRRRGTFLDALVRALKQRGVPVAGADRILLTEQLAVMDLMALGHALLLPSDDLTLATVLKSPLIGLDEDQLYRLAHGREGSLWRRLQSTKDAEPAFTAAHDTLADLLARVDYLSPFALFAHVLGPLGGRRKIQARLGPESLDALEEFLNAALAHERAHPPSLQGFLHWLEAAAEDIKRDLEHGARDEVRVMTVHGAKGLQAPIVILPDTVSPLRDDPGVLWTEDGLPLWCPRAEDADPVAGRARASARTRREEEHRRLLYVAMTRAEDRLYVCGWRTSERKSSGTWYDLVASAFENLAGVEPVVERPARRYVSQQTAAVETPKAAADAAAIPALPDWARMDAKAEPRPPRPLAPSRPEDPEPPVRSPLIAEDGFRFRRGRLVHRLLQSLPDLPREARAEAARRWLDRPGQGITPEQTEALLKETLSILDAPDLLPLFGAGSRAEVPVTGVIGSHVVSGQVDRLVALADRVIVIDYKTNRPPPLEPEQVAPLYLRQMAAYRAVLRKVYEGRPVECRLLWTDGPRQMALPDGLLDRFAPV